MIHKGGSCRKIITVGLDLAKNVFQVHGADAAGRAVLRKKLRRDQVAGIRSERLLRDEVHLKSANRWVCRLGLDGKVPELSTVSGYRDGKFRESNLLRQVFETTVERCLKEAQLSGEGFAVDASISRPTPRRSGPLRPRIGGQKSRARSARDCLAQPKVVALAHNAL